MTHEEAVKMLNAKSECILRGVSGTNSLCNNNRCEDCELNYAQGTMGEQREALQMAVEALEKQIPMKPLPKELAEQQPFGNNPVYVIPCGSCGEPLNFLFPYCPWCGQKVDWEGER